jgi:LysM repeat protein
VKHTGYLLVVFSLLLGVQDAFSQFEPAPVTRSAVTETIDGKLYYVHTIEPGQTLFSIARAYQVTPRAIAEANPETPDLIEVVRSGQTIRIPADSSTPAASPVADSAKAPSDQRLGAQPRVVRATMEFTEFVEHEVGRRETLYGIARKYGVSQEDILQYNPEARTGLRFRQVIRIPQKTSRPVEFFYYTVGAGDTKFGLSKQFGISQEELEWLNPGIKELGLIAGHQIRIPAESIEEKSVIPTPEQGLFFLPGDTIPQQAHFVDEYCLDPELKSRYHVALLIPLFLDQFEGYSPTLPADHISFTFIHYYQGILIALDSVQKLGHNITLHVQDIGMDVEKVSNLTRQQGFEDMDLIIGPFYPEALKEVTSFALRHDIPVVSPLLDNSSQLQGFPNLFQVSPSMETQLSSLAGYLARAYPDENIILVHNDQQQARDLISGFRDALRIEFNDMRRLEDSLSLARVDGYYFNGAMVGRRRTNVLVVNDSLFLQQRTRRRHSQITPHEFKEIVFNDGGIDALTKVFEKEKKNIVITLIGGEAFLSNYLRQLDEFTGDYDITLFGTPQWSDYQTIDPQYLENLNVHIFSPDFVEYHDQHVRDFVYRYRQQFNTEPSVDAFRGVNTGYFFFNALATYGKQFPRCIENLNGKSFQNPFLFEKLQTENDGWENLKFILYRHREFRRENVLRPYQEETEENLDD